MMTSAAVQRQCRNLLSIADLSPADLNWLISRSREFFRDQTRGCTLLSDRYVGTIFTLTSTRTRTAFTIGAARLGAKVIAYGADELQISTGETLADTGRVLGGMLDLLVIRDLTSVAGLRELSRAAEIPVINGMSTDEHPTQGISDLAILAEHFGALDGIRVAYLGEGNSTAAALSLGLAQVPGASLTLATPAGYDLDPVTLATAKSLAAANRATVDITHCADDIAGSVDVLYTTQWRTTGTTKADQEWIGAFRPFTVDERMMARWPGAVLMHDLPAHRGEEVSAAVLDGPRSIAWTQAQMKLYSAMAVLQWCLLPGTGDL
jgi:ornithine carbamoyltransferase